jgi:hypothetical protein
MPASVADKLAAVIGQIDETGNADLLRLTVLKKWFERPGRLTAFAIWTAFHAASRGGKATGPARDLIQEAQELLSARGERSELDAVAAERLHRRLRAFQNTRQRLKWGSVRIVKVSDLLLVEKALAAYLWHPHPPSQGYRLAVAYCEHYHPRYGTSLNGPSRVRLEEIVDFIQYREAQEADSERPSPLRP